MKRIILGYLLTTCCILAIQGQKKELTIELAVKDRFGELYPEYFPQLRWRGDLNVFTYVRKGKLFQAGVNDKTTELLAFTEVNEVLEKEGIPTLTRVPLFSWKDNNTIQFEHTHRVIEFDIKKKKLTSAVFLDSLAENTDVCNENGHIAYTIENNLFITHEKGIKRQITKEPDKGIVSAQAVHRREFGISKGTFWSPEGNYLAFYRKDETMVSDYPLVDIFKRIAAPSGTRYPMAGMTSEQVTLQIYNMETKQTLEVQTGEPAEQYLTNISWSPDEKYIYITVVNRDQNHLKLNQYDVSSGRFIKTLFEEKHDKYVEPLHPMLFLSKGDRFIWQSRSDGFNHLFLYNTNGKLLRQLTKGDWEVTEVHGFDKNEAFLYFVSTKESPIERHFYKVKLEDATVTRLTEEKGTHTILLSDDGSFFLDNYSSTTVPRKVFLSDNHGKILKTLLVSDDPLEEYSIGELEIFTIKADDGTTDLYCRMIKPADFDPEKKYPVIVYVYGGPHAQMISDSWLGGARLWQFAMSGKGYVMFTVDNRGSSNRGLDFENAIFRNLGALETADQMKGVEYLKSLDFVDTSRIGVHGWSYGGFMTISLMERYPDVFKVGVAGGPVTDWKYYEVMYGERYMDTPEDNPEGYKNASLIDKTENIKGKLLVIHGYRDDVVVLQHSLVFIEECIKNNIPVDYFLYPSQGHNVYGAQRVHLMEKITLYFEDYLHTD